MFDDIQEKLFFIMIKVNLFRKHATLFIHLFNYQKLIIHFKCKTK